MPNSQKCITLVTFYKRCFTQKCLFNVYKPGKFSYFFLYVFDSLSFILACKHFHTSKGGPTICCLHSSFSRLQQPREWLTSRMSLFSPSDVQSPSCVWKRRRLRWTSSPSRKAPLTRRATAQAATTSNRSPEVSNPEDGVQLARDQLHGGRRRPSKDQDVRVRTRWDNIWPTLGPWPGV